MDELKEVLTQTAKVLKIPKFEVKIDQDRKGGDGFVGQIYTGQIQAFEQNRLDVVIKRIQIQEKVFKDLYQNEVIFYTVILKSLRNFRDVPTLYHHCLGTNNDAYLVLENLKKQQFQLYPKERHFDSKHLALIFSAYARLHASAFVWRSRDPQDYHRVHHLEYQDVTLSRLEACKDILEHSTRAALEYLEHSSEVYRELEELPQNLLPILVKANRYTGPYSCSIHGDGWSNNMLFRYGESGEPIEVKLIDFQMGGNSTPVHDLAYFFYSGASKSDLDHLDHYLQDYHSLLAAILKENSLEVEEVFPYQALEKEWNEYGILGLIYGIHLWEVKLTSKDEFADDINDLGEGSQDKLVEMIGKFGNTMNKEEWRDRVVPLLIHGYQTGILAKNRIITEK